MCKQYHVIQRGLFGQSVAILRVKHKLHNMLTLNDVSLQYDLDTLQVCRGRCGNDVDTAAVLWASAQIR